MAFDNRDLDLKAPQHITLENREHLSISGVEEVESFDESTILMSTSLGELMVRGQDLHPEPGGRRPEGGGHHRLPDL